MLNSKKLRRNTENVYLDFLDLTSVMNEGITAIFDDPKRYRDSRILSLFLHMLRRDLKNEPVTLDDMLEFMSESSSKSTRLRLIEYARRDGHIVSVRKSELEEPHDLNSTNAKKAFFVSDEIRAAMLVELDKLIDEFILFAERYSSDLESNI